MDSSERPTLPVLELLPGKVTVSENSVSLQALLLKVSAAAFSTSHPVPSPHHLLLSITEDLWQPQSPGHSFTSMWNLHCVFRLCELIFIEW